MWPEWLKEGLTEISPIPERMELDYLYRMQQKFVKKFDRLLIHHPESILDQQREVFRP